MSLDWSYICDHCLTRIIVIYMLTESLDYDIGTLNGPTMYGTWSPELAIYITRHLYICTVTFIKWRPDTHSLVGPLIEVADYTASGYN